jgi:hypothetical protein
MCLKGKIGSLKSAGFSIHCQGENWLGVHHALSSCSLTLTLLFAGHVRDAFLKVLKRNSPEFSSEGLLKLVSLSCQSR